MNHPATYVYRKLIPNGVEISLERKTYQITYPLTLWQQFPEFFRQNFADFLTYALTVHLCLNGHQKLIYNFPHPPIEPFIFESMMYSFGETVLISQNKLLMRDLIKDFYNKNLNIEFTGRPRFSRFKNIARNTKNRVIIPFSFGKDSLLTFALSRELGIEPQLVFFQEPKSPYENRQKSKLADRFAKNFSIDVNFFPVAPGRLRHNEGNYWGWDLLFTQYTLMLVPYIFGLRARYLFWSHEFDCNDFFANHEGYKINPVFEQSSRWLLVLNNVARFLGSNVLFASLIEPINEISTTWILHHRYPEIAKFQFSCFAEEKDRANRRWCGRCEKCATIYLFFCALGIDPKVVSFKESMFGDEKKKLFVLFDNLERKDTWRDQQLLAFLLAYKKGIKGELIKEFKIKYLKEAEARERELRSYFFGIHPSDTLTYELKSHLLKIYQEELSSLQ
ncbi:MAG: hypothetical protein UY21_C0008G0019 [Microgenomates group bacterium GW2011_GWA1_48_10]|uniref:UDP-N-acetyl-alpha-D-muramoyl-L-alanyl-L-glutamate epimerase n=1 Tax=Candidatus Gottesmanbacteria bacterium RIFCSPHIGHO2_01_FULL_47_48 TaxID=1798381 RepID=A0A1F6A345_9BACT|nr:MAG: hypothetical protein UY21_C0008G0019 [Microgenomates group bacterium GW2011_GWA1_48_10]OGG19069.1 MAG: hypothetical protein A2721_00720 [Candidatus Gottesmanbacteria bacterium RIFCSPHIGHO2_01_FULL_47_48]